MPYLKDTGPTTIDEHRRCREDRLEVIATADARYRTAFIDGLKELYEAPVDRDQELTRWALGHYAVGSSDKLSFQVKHTYRAFTKDTIHWHVRGALQRALVDYSHDLIDNIIWGAAKAKSERLTMATTNSLWYYAARLRPNSAPKHYGTRWWFIHKEDPDDIDLINRNQFLRAVHYTNLAVTEHQPQLPEQPEWSIFDPVGVKTHHLRRCPRNLKGQRASTDDMLNGKN